MKKLFLTFGLMIAITTFSLPTYAGDEFNGNIYLASEQPGIDPNKGYPRVPARPLTINQNGHTLYFPDETGYFVNLYTIDEDGEKTLEYATFVSCDSVLLPSDLQGTYAIEVIRGKRHFWGEIELD